MSLPVNQVILGDCVEVMAEWPENSVDCILTDPPYGISFMGKEWDKALPPRGAFEQMIRVLKPGALAFVMSSPRQDVLWRMLAMLEGVGFHLRQSHISWITKTGFPKAYDVSAGIDRKLGLLDQRKTIGHYKIPSDSEAGNAGKSYSDMPIDGYVYQDPHRDTRKASITEPVSDLAKKWQGYKSQTGLKPAVEMILMVNKPRSEKTIVDNVLKWGTGAMNVDACRIPLKPNDNSAHYGGLHESPPGYSGGFSEGYKTQEHRNGRFPANLIISNGALDTGETTKSNVRLSEDKDIPRSTWSLGRTGITPRGHDDKGSMYRFFDLDAWAEHHGFLDVAKPSRAERDMGLWTQPLRVPKSKFNLNDGSKDMRFDGVIPKKRRNVHPTVKPVKLMAYLIELGCPKDGVVVDPFVGSGTTCIAAKRLRRRWIGIEINPEYVDIARARIDIKGLLDQYLEDKL